MRFNLFVFFIIIWFLRGFLSEYLLGFDMFYDRRRVDRDITKLILELPVIILFLLSIFDIRRKRNSIFISMPIKIKKSSLYFVNLSAPVILFVFWAIISSYVNDLPVTNAIKYSRYLVFSLMLSIISYNTLNTPLRINRCIVVFYILILVQIFSSSVNYIVYGPSEARIGTLAVAFGSLGTVFPLTVMSFFIAYYLVVSRRVKWIMITFMLLIIGISTGKRALVYAMPLFSLFFMFIAKYFKVMPSNIVIKKHVVALSISLVIASPLIAYYINNANFGQTAEFEQLSTLRKVEHLIRYAVDYEKDEDSRGMARGRTGASTIIFNSVIDNDIPFWGIGPMQLYDEEIRGYGSGYIPLGIVYGIVGWGRDTLSIGYVSVFFILWYIGILLNANLKIIKYKEGIPTRILFISVGCVFAIFTFLFDYFFYSANSFISGFPLYLITIGTGIIQAFNNQPELGKRLQK